MMRLAIKIGFAALLAGCGSATFTGDAKAVNQLCLKNSGTAAYCECTTKELQAKLAPEVFALVAKGETGSDPAATLDVMAAADKVCKKP
ncbi:MAG: hypothetical protein ABMA14_08550 [Hyphomonadaceae bacterium]